MECMGAEAHKYALHVLCEFNSWEEVGCDASQGMPL